MLSKKLVLGKKWTHFVDAFVYKKAASHLIWTIFLCDTYFRSNLRLQVKTGQPLE